VNVHIGSQTESILADVIDRNQFADHQHEGEGPGLITVEELAEHIVAIVAEWSVRPHAHVPVSAIYLEAVDRVNGTYHSMPNTMYDSHLMR